jgi:hypothetical protein
MNRVTLKPNGMLESNGGSITSKPLLYLGFGLDLAPTCTLRSYFHMLNTYAPFSQLGDFFTVLDQQYVKCPDMGCCWSELDYLEFSKTVEMIGFPDDPRLEIYNALRGIKGDAAQEIRTLPLEALLDMPLRMGQLKHVIFGDRVDTFNFDTIYTLFEFIDSVAWELSFHGAPPECQMRS